MTEFARYVVEGTKRLNRHGYSTELGDRRALCYAKECANHHSMQGMVFGEDSQGNRELVFTNSHCKKVIDSIEADNNPNNLLGLP